MSDATQEPDHSDPFLNEAYGLRDLQSAMDFYERWADEYDDQMEDKLGYVAPRLMAERLAAFIPDTNARVLDVGCGTGLTSHYMANLGFGRIDGIDITPNMLERAGTRGIYESLFEADITKPLDLETASYDAILSSGTFTLGHVGPEPLPELVRVLSTGGHFGCTIHAELWTDGGFREGFAELCDQGLLREVEQTVGEFFTGKGNVALYCVYERI